MSNRLTIKGQVTIPKNVRDFLNLTMGSSQVDFSIEPDGSVRIVKVPAHPVTERGQTVENRRTGTMPCDRILALLSGSFI